AGWEIGSHTRSHANLIRLGDAELVEELAGSKMAIEANLGGEVTALAYPYGLADDRVRTAARTAGYRLGLGTCPGKLDLGDDPLDLPRIIVKRRDTLLDLRLKLGKGRSSL
ncbi:MAG: polysaccharide deacetylase family protein, partial [Proteobacteria bacterium]|nr:polysaccharide deacetylase family protein [Pseudomonadota bacterium]